MFMYKDEAPATQGRSHLGAGASRLRAAGGDSTYAGRFTASQRGERPKLELTKNYFKAPVAGEEPAETP